MKDMNLSATTKDDFIEFVAATFFRVQAILQALYALQNLAFTFVSHLENAPASSSNSPVIRNSVHTLFLYSVTSCIQSVLISVLLFFLAVPLARLIRRSLSHAWESTIHEVARKAGWIELLMTVLFRALAVGLILEAVCETARTSFVRIIDNSLGSFLLLMTLVPFLILILIPAALFIFSLYFARKLSTGLGRALFPNPFSSR